MAFKCRKSQYSSFEEEMWDVASLWTRNRERSGTHWRCLVLHHPSSLTSGELLLRAMRVIAYHGGKQIHRRVSEGDTVSGDKHQTNKSIIIIISQSVVQIFLVSVVFVKRFQTLTGSIIVEWTSHDYDISYYVTFYVCNVTVIGAFKC